MTDLLEQAAADLRSSLSYEGPSVSDLRARGQRRRRRQLSAGLLVAGLGAVTLFAVWPSDRSEVNVSASQPDAEPPSEAPPASTPASGTPVAQGECSPMPNLIGMEEGPAMAALGTVGSTWQIGERQSDTDPVGIVLDQSPPPETPVCTDTNIKITLSTTPYTVQAGDTYVSIATAEGVDVDVLLAVNGRTLDTPLAPGQQLIIPGRDTPPYSATDSTVFATIPTSSTVAGVTGECLLYTVEPGDSLASIAAKFDLGLGDLVRVNPGLVPRVEGVEAGRAPVTGFEPGRIDVFAPGNLVNIPYAGTPPDPSQVICDVDGDPVG